jgi:hypothetical protein
MSEGLRKIAEDCFKHRNKTEPVDPPESLILFSEQISCLLDWGRSLTGTLLDFFKNRKNGQDFLSGEETSEKETMEFIDGF